MENITFAPAIQKKDIKKDGTCFVRIRATLKRKCKYIKTTICITEKQLTKDLRIKDKTICGKIDDVLYELRKKAATIPTEELETMSVDEAVRRITGEEEGKFRLDFPEYAEEVIKTLGAGAKNYRCAVHALQDFFKRKKFDISELTSSTLFRFEKHLERKHGKGARAISLYTKSIAFLHSRARQEYNAEETGLLRIPNPYLHYKCPAPPHPKHRNASPELISQMISLRGSLEGLERFGVDVFLISFGLMGMNSPDLHECKKEKNGIIVYNRHKTRSRRADDAEMRVRIEPCIRGIVDQYKGEKGMEFDFANRYETFDALSQGVNKGLKRFAERISLETPLTLYVARHTWASIAASKACRIDKGTINDCLCHTDPDYSVTDIYREKDWEVLWDANAKVLSLFEWK